MKGHPRFSEIEFSRVHGDEGDGLLQNIQLTPAPEERHIPMMNRGRYRRIQPSNTVVALANFAKFAVVLLVIVGSVGVAYYVLNDENVPEPAPQPEARIIVEASPSPPYVEPSPSSSPPVRKQEPMEADIGVPYVAGQPGDLGRDGYGPKAEFYIPPPTKGKKKTGYGSGAPQNTLPFYVPGAIPAQGYAVGPSQGVYAPAGVVGGQAQPFVPGAQQQPFPGSVPGQAYVPQAGGVPGQTVQPGVIPGGQAYAPAPGQTYVPTQPGQAYAPAQQVAGQAYIPGQPLASGQQPIPGQPYSQPAPGQAAIPGQPSYPGAVPAQQSIPGQPYVPGQQVPTQGTIPGQVAFPPGGAPAQQAYVPGQVAPGQVAPGQAYSPSQSYIPGAVQQPGQVYVPGQVIPQPGSGAVSQQPGQAGQQLIPGQASVPGQAGQTTYPPGAVSQQPIPGQQTVPGPQVIPGQAGQTTYPPGAVSQQSGQAYVPGQQVIPGQQGQTSYPPGAQQPIPGPGQQVIPAQGVAPGQGTYPAGTVPSQAYIPGQPTIPAQQYIPGQEAVSGQVAFPPGAPGQAGQNYVPGQAGQTTYPPGAAQQPGQPEQQVIPGQPYVPGQQGQTSYPPGAVSQQPIPGQQAVPGQPIPQVIPGQAGQTTYPPGSVSQQPNASGQEAVPGQVAYPPAGVVPQQVAPGQVAPGQVAPGQVAPGQVAPGQVAPGQVAPGQVAPGQVAPGQVAPGQEATAPIYASPSVAPATMTASHSPAASFSPSPSPLPLGNQAVITDNEECSAIGVKVLEQGGNAVDSAVASLLCLTVTNPFSASLGGDGLLMVTMPALRLVKPETHVLDFRGAAPSSLDMQAYIENPTRRFQGPYASTVPSLLKGLRAAHAKWGSRSWSAVVQPSVDLASTGFTVSHTLASNLAQNKEFVMNSNAMKAVFSTGDALVQEGQKIKWPAIAATLAAVKLNPDSFYESEDFEADLDDIGVRISYLKRSDFQQYFPVMRAALNATIQAGRHEIVVAPPPSSGFLAVLGMQVLEQVLSKYPASTVVNVYHKWIEAFKLALARSPYLAEANTQSMVDLISRFTSREYAAELSGLFRVADGPGMGVYDTEASYSLINTTTDSNNNASSATVADPDLVGIKFGDVPSAENPLSLAQAQVTVVDNSSMAVSLVTALGRPFGSQVVLGRTGVVLNSHMEDFSYDESHPNSADPGKRPGTWMCPITVLAQTNLDSVMSGGGGFGGFAAQVKLLVDMLVLGNPAAKAMYSPRFVNPLHPYQLLVEPNVDAQLQQYLTRLGHKTSGNFTSVVSSGPYLGRVQMVKMFGTRAQAIVESTKRDHDMSAKTQST